MVTVIYKDIDEDYLTKDLWIERGITTDAIYFVGDIWHNDHSTNDYSFITTARNKITDYTNKRFQPLYPLNKW